MNRPILSLALLLAIALPLLAQPEQKPDPWRKVALLKGGTDLRIFKSGSAQPVLASFADLNEDNLIVVIKNTETAILKSAIDRIEARAKPGGRVKTETRDTETLPDTSISNPREHPIGPSTSSSTNLVFGSKGDFQTVYRRTAASTPAPQ